MRSRPAAEWRPLPYGLLPGLPPIPSPLYEAVERLVLRDEGTGATFQALEKRGLIICRYHQPGQETERNSDMIECERLHLVPCEPAHIAALLRSREELGTMLQITLPDGWPHFPEAFSPETSARLESTPALEGWYGYFFIEPHARILVGSGGFAGPPDENGIVEIGYEIAPAYQNRGFATAAAQALIAHAFSHTLVKAVIAHTLAEANASNTVLRKVGMTFVEAIEDPEHGTVWRWQILPA